ncbi:MAG: hypothetical protein QXZ17_12405 [Nitrososphaerota archaeon]
MENIGKLFKHIELNKSSYEALRRSLTFLRRLGCSTSWWLG